MSTTSKEWREKRAKGIEITLPEYGDVVSIRPMDAGFFFLAGRIPDFLAPIISQILAGKAWQMDVPETPTPEKQKEWLDWLDELVRYTFVSPKVVDNPQADDEISIEEVSYSDKLFLYSWFGRPAQVLRRFRDAQTKPLAIVDAPKNDGENAVESDEGSETGFADTRTA